MSGRHESKPMDPRDVDHMTYVAGLKALMEGPVTDDVVIVRVIVRCAECRGRSESRPLGQVEEEPRQTVFHTPYGVLLKARRRGGKRTPPTYTWGKWRLEPKVHGTPAVHCPRHGARPITAAILLEAVERSRRNEREQRGRGTVTHRRRRAGQRRPAPQPA